jgi:hypothetical protein
MPLEFKKQILEEVDRIRRVLTVLELAVMHHDDCDPLNQAALIEGSIGRIIDALEGTR